MRVDLGKFSINISKKKSLSYDEQFTIDDLFEFNEQYLDYLKSLTKEEIRDRILEITVAELNDDNTLKEARKILDKKGIVVVPDFFNSETLQSIESANIQLFEKINNFEIEKNQLFEDDQILIQSKKPKVVGYKDLSEYPKTIVNIRQGQDEGMVDVFNVNKSKYYQDLEIVELINNKKELSQLISGLQKGLSVSNINIYHNKNILKTRGFHLDDYSNTLKAFIYLTDVDDLDHGPYCYVSETHNDNLFRKANSFISQKAPKNTETPFVPFQNIIPILGKKGTLVISDQTGFHRGIPQKQGFERNVLVVRYS